MQPIFPAYPKGASLSFGAMGWLSVTQEDTGTRVGLGECMRRIVERWAIPLPDLPVDRDS